MLSCLLAGGGPCCRHQAESGVRAGHPLGPQGRAARCRQGKEEPFLPLTGQRAGTAQCIPALTRSKELLLPTLEVPFGSAVAAGLPTVQSPAVLAGPRRAVLQHPETRRAPGVFASSR